MIRNYWYKKCILFVEIESFGEKNRYRTHITRPGNPQDLNTSIRFNYSSMHTHKNYPDAQNELDQFAMDKQLQEVGFEMNPCAMCGSPGVVEYNETVILRIAGITLTKLEPSFSHGCANAACPNYDIHNLFPNKRSAVDDWNKDNPVKAKTVSKYHQKMIQRRKALLKNAGEESDVN